MPDNNRSDLSGLLSSLLQNKNLKRKLEVHADRLLRKSTKSKFAQHLLPSDFISSITLKLLTGEINWNSEKCSLSAFFFSRIGTEILNLTKKEKKFIPVPLEDSESFSDYEGEIIDDIPLSPQFIIDPFKDNNDEEEIDPVEFKKIAYEIFKDSEKEFCVLDEMFKGHKSNKIALNLGISENDVHNTKRRISRVLEAKVKSKPFVKPNFKNKPGKSIPDNNNNGELI